MDAFLIQCEVKERKHYTHTHMHTRRDQQNLFFPLFLKDEILVAAADLPSNYQHTTETRTGPNRTDKGKSQHADCEMQHSISNASKVKMLNLHNFDLQME